MRDGSDRTSGCPYQAHSEEAAPSPRTPDPCRDYLLLRDEEPVRRDDVLGVWFVTGHHEVRRLLGHPALSSAWQQGGRTRLHEESGSASSASGARAAELVRGWFMFRDGPGHADMRRLVAPLFSAQRLAELRPYVMERVAELVPEGRSTLDIVTDVAVPLSSSIICRLLGLPAGVAPLLSGWADDLAALLVADYRPEVVERGRRALAEIAAVVAEAGSAGDFPEGSGLDVLHTAHRRGAIEAADVPDTAALLVYAGFETTSTFIGKAVRSLLHADAWSRLGDVEPDALVTELLRFDTSVGQVARLALADIEVAGRTIGRGDLVLLMLGTADRDPHVFADPDHLAFGRAVKRHLAFGHGAHYCLGAGLARLETAAVLGRLHAVWRSAAVVGPPSAPALDAGHGLAHLHVRGEPRHAAAGI
ncbi:cytochrome P450 [Streptomyces sp. NPDC005562]|uniref:cytochrome P450 n=1 Tax=Streptomyces sp. NPDC005562 TaxID=3154890 RepID=UPI0033ACFDFF